MYILRNCFFYKSVSVNISARQITSFNLFTSELHQKAFFTCLSTKTVDCWS